MRLLVFIFVLLGVSASAQSRGEREAQFQSWLAGTVWPQAQAAGVSRGTFERALGGVTLNWNLPDLVPPAQQGQQSQSEFGAPGRYFASGPVGSATRIGRQEAQRFASTLARVEAQTGVPPGILLSIWGRESSFGRADIPHNAFDVLATKGFAATRADYFRTELIAALQIAERGQGPTPLRSSWAGALGQPQFMPSNYLRFAVDGDGDGRVDIWGSQADTLASIGNYLAAKGWQAGLDWGFEVNLPSNLSCALEGPDQRRRTSEWVNLGVTRVSGRPFPAREMGARTSLMLPAGRNGPAFLVTENFYVLKEYNQSDLYALFVGHVGDRISYGSGDFAGRWAPVDRIKRSEVVTLQRALEQRGYDVGGADGLVGFKTRRAIGAWQEAQGQAATCFPNAGMVR